MEAFIDRVTEVNPLINAVVAERYQVALTEAMEVDKKLAGADGLDASLSVENAPFLGVPVSIKEAFSVKGRKQVFLMRCKNLSFEIFWKKFWS